MNQNLDGGIRSAVKAAKQLALLQRTHSREFSPQTLRALAVAQQQLAGELALFFGLPHQPAVVGPVKNVETPTLA
jgi:hypothetical protein